MARALEGMQSEWVVKEARGTDAPGTDACDLRSGAIPSQDVDVFDPEAEVILPLFDRALEDGVLALRDTVV